MASNEPQQDLAHLNPHHHDDDTIDLGALLRGLFQQWLLIGAIAIGVTIAGVIVAIMLPNQFRVEAIVSQPSRQDVQPLLTQTVEPITLNELSRTFLVNLRSFALVEAAFESSGLADAQSEELGSEEARVTAIRELRNGLMIEPVELTFLGEEETTTSLENVSVSLLSADPTLSQSFLNDLLQRAATDTLASYKRNIEAARDIRIAKIESQLNSIESAAEITLDNRIYEVEQALSIAESLGIEAPTNWEALVHGADNVQYINLRETTDSDLFLQGTRILSAQLAGLNREGAARLFEHGIQENEVVSAPSQSGNSAANVPQVVSRTISSTELRGERASLQRIQVDLDQVSLLGEDSQASIPANAESPNRKLIAVASVVFGGILGILVALIRIAVRNGD